MHLFTYGTLMFPSIWRRVAGLDFERREAMLTGHAVYRVRGDVYPVLVPSDPSAGAPGIVYFDVDGETLERLDQYESDYYDRQPVQVRLPDRQMVACETYLLAPEHRSRCTKLPWTAAWFEEHALSDYLQRF